MHTPDVLELALHGLALAYLLSRSEPERSERLREATSLLDSHECARSLAGAEKMGRWLSAVRRVEAALAEIRSRSLATCTPSAVRH